ncbi:hypothetical protein IFM89_038130 [Coptis chinensis]|uniref:Autophagy-related protein 2 n=1 Tax=Coptis chinensis TaxID=261450 RepID=A0A835HSZ2_9MAGN|nr:hypothetical protein IFM89_038130 [Coptis chinensis]
MFPWNIAKSAEAMFSRWAIKHVLKFLLKKKLGQFILGDLDLEQLDVQLGSGTLQLTDLALNVDYINQKLGSSPIILKEGSIGSLLAKLPWKVSNCQIEVDELELVFVPWVSSHSSGAAETSDLIGGCKQQVSPGSGKLEHEMVNNSSTPISLDVHEGVKTIAKMVKWLLTSFHIKVKKLIVAYDPYSDKLKPTGPHRALVLRIREMEYGTCVSEDANKRSNSRVDSLLGLSRLTNFVKFQGAIVEFLQMDDVENQTQTPTFSQCPMGSFPSETTPILTGEGGGFSGHLKLSIPWRNGSLDIHKVDADLSVDPMKIRLQPSTITWILCFWHSLKNVEQDIQGHMHENSTNSVYFSSTSQFHYSTPGSSVIAIDRGSTSSGHFAGGYFSQTSQETQRDALLRGSHVIPDWVALSTNLNQTDGAEAEPDLSASIDQFFECFDGLRTSHSALGSSGILNWTCSVFSAITAASSLASGSLHVPSEQQPVETNFKASFSGISVELYLSDEDETAGYGLSGNSINNDQCAQYLGAKCQGLLLVLQIGLRDTKFEATVKQFELDHYFSNGTEAVGSDFWGCESTIQNRLLFIENMQAKVQGALPSLPFLKELDSEATRTGSCLSSSPISPNVRLRNISCGNVSRNDFVKVNLLKTSTVTPSQLTMKKTQLDGGPTSSTSFSVKLPPFIFWVNFKLVKRLLDLLKGIENCSEMKNSRKEFGFGDHSRRFNSSCPTDMKGGTNTCLPTSSSKGSLRGSISLSNARIILCIPMENHGDFTCNSFWHRFIGLDITQALSKERFVDACSKDASLASAFADKFSSSINLNLGNLKMYLIAGNGQDVGQNMSAFLKHTYLAKEIFSVTAGTKCFSCISVLWQDGPVTGPWVAKRARGLATSDDSTRSRTRVTGKGSEFASVTTMGDQEDINSCKHEMIFSSTVLLHIRLPSVSLKFTSSEYQLLHCLITQIMGDLSHVALDATSTSTCSIEKDVAFTSQTSVLVECNTLEVSINTDKLEDIKCSLQKELSGSWHRLKLQIQELELLSVSNIGGISGGNFFWLGHGEGQLQGYVDAFPDDEFLLISSSTSAMRRGDGEGANALSSGSAGIAIVYLSDPQILQNFTNVTIRGGTIIAPGGRLDWLNVIYNFFSLPCESDVASPKSEDSRGYGESFVLNLVDSALSYEPWLSNLMMSDRVLEPDFNSYANVGEEFGEHVACLVAAASLHLSNQTVASSVENDYKIRFQDLGLLLCASSGPQKGNTYGVEYLHKTGYVKVAGEALVEAVLRTNCQNGLLWELECCDSHINLDTCHDTTSGLVRLAAQLQQLFAPDLQESMVHLQSRWKAVQQLNCANDFINNTNIFVGGSASSPSGQNASGSGRYEVVGLMDDICEDAFQFKGIGTSASDPCELQNTISLDEGHLGEVYCSNISNPEYFSHNVSFNGPVPLGGSGSTCTSSPQKNSFPNLIESHCISGLSPLAETSDKRNSIKCKSRNQAHADVGRASSGWYQESSLRIVENHIPKVTEKPGQEEIPRKCERPSKNCSSPADICIAGGRVLLKNIGVRWRMYGGSDWHAPTQNGMLSEDGSGRDTSVCLELALSAVDLQYDMYPDGQLCVSKLSLSVQDVNLYDQSRDAPWKLVLGHYHSKDHPRESSAKAFKFDLEAVRPDPSTPLEEYRLRLALLPILLHLDQDQVDFLISFFGGKESLVDQSPSPPRDVYDSVKSSESGGIVSFFPQKFDIWPIVVRVDYSPRRVDLAALRGGNYVHLVNLVPWKGVELKLKHVHAVGIYGWSSVCETIMGEWLEDISNNQIHKFLRGLPPIRSLFTVSSGAAKLVSLPVKSYKKDHRLLKGIQRGAIAFLRSISLEAVGLGVHLAAGAHDVLLQTEYIFTSSPPPVSSPRRCKRKTNVRSNQPKDAQQGIQQAYESLSDGLGKTASALVGNPLKTYQRGGGAGSALASVVCAAPSAAIAPASAAVRAVHCALLGVRNRLKALQPEDWNQARDVCVCIICMWYTCN